MSTEQITRDRIAEKDKWQLQDLFKNDTDWETEFGRIKKQVPELVKFKGTLTSAENLLLAISQMHDVEEALGKLYAYAHMRNDEDKSVTKHQEQYDRMGGLVVEYNQAVAFFEPELLTLDEETLKQFLQHPDMDVYRHFIENVTRVKPHILSEKEERLMALAGEVRRAPADIFSMFDNADIEFPVIKGEDGKDIRLTNALYGKFQQSPDRRLRTDSYHALYKPYLANRNMLASS